MLLIRADRGRDALRRTRTGPVIASASCLADHDGSCTCVERVGPLGLENQYLVPLAVAAISPCPARPTAAVRSGAPGGRVRGRAGPAHLRNRASMRGSPPGQAGAAPTRAPRRAGGQTGLCGAGVRIPRWSTVIARAGAIAAPGPPQGAGLAAPSRAQWSAIPTQPGEDLPQSLLRLC
jgi:hypothetical protein